MKIVCFIASHITPYRYITIKKAIKSINDMAGFESNENYKMDIFVSFSYDENITSEMIDTLIDTCNTECLNLNIIWYKHDTTKFQFEHIKHIVDNNNFTFDTWIIFQDDDDTSMKNRLKHFIDSKCYLFSYDSYSSFGVVCDRTHPLNSSQYNEIELYNNDISTDNDHTTKEFKSINLKRDFATKIVNYNVIYNFFKQDINIYDIFTDVCFSNYISGFYKEYNDNKINYIINIRFSTTDEQYIEWFNNKMI